MKNLLNFEDPVYLLFGWDAKEARPNCDPFTGNLRVHTQTNQVWTTKVHLKHHIRRTFPEVGKLFLKDKAEFATFYKKFGEDGDPISFNRRLDALAKAFGFDKSYGRAPVDYTLDLPLFGFVNAYQNPKK